MSIDLGNLLVKATAEEEFIDQNYAIHHPGTLLSITDLITYKRITIFLYKLDQGVQGFIQLRENLPYDPFFLDVPINKVIYFQYEDYQFSLRFYPFNYCASTGQYPIELAIDMPDQESQVSIEVSFDGNIRLYHN